MISGYAKGISWRRCSRRGIRRSIHIGGRAPLGRPAEMRAAESAEMRAAESAEGAGADTVGAATAGFGGEGGGEGGGREARVRVSSNNP
jgi:hypothetical protein